MQNWRGLVGICALVFAIVCALAAAPAHVALADDRADAATAEGGKDTANLAEDGADAAESEAPAEAKPERGSITLTFTSDDGGPELVGGKLAIYCVATEGYDENGQKVFDVSGGQFASSQTVSVIPGVTQESLDQQNREIAEALEAQVRARSLQPLMTASVQSGKAVFSPLERGLYLIFQSELSERDEKANTFLMTVPGVDGHLDVVSKPKHGIYKPENSSGNSSSIAESTQSTVNPQDPNKSYSELTKPGTRPLAKGSDETPVLAPLAAAALALLCLVPAFVKRS